MTNKNIKTKEGAASIFVVIFATLLVGIISVGFVQLIMRGDKNTVDNDLANSAYDAAMVGIEDAERAISNPSYAANMGDDNCYFVAQALYNLDNTEIIVDKTYDSDANVEMNEAYTCVTVNDETDDYKGTLSSSNVVAVIPLSEVSNGTEMKQIRVRWTKQGYDDWSFRYNNESSFNEVSGESDKANPPTLAFQYVQVSDGTFNYEDFIDGNSNNGRRDIPDGGNGSSKIILTTSDSGKNTVDYSLFTSSTDAIKVQCNSTDDYACSATVEVVESGRTTTANKYLILSLPYGGPETNFKVEMLDKAGNIVKFSGVQYEVDSTGRADDVYVRLEARLDTVDPNTPYPQFAAEFRDSDTGLNKNFWVTIENCRIINNGQDTGICDTSGPVE